MCVFVEDKPTTSDPYFKLEVIVILKNKLLQLHIPLEEIYMKVYNLKTSGQWKYLKIKY